MKQTIKLRTFLILLITITAFLGIIAIVSGRFVHNITKNEVSETEYIKSSEVMPEHSIMQEFYPEEDYLSAVSIMIEPDYLFSGLFYFNLYDKDLNKIFESAQRLIFTGEQNRQFYRFPVSTKVESGQPYYYTVEYKDVPFSVSLVEVKQSDTNNGRTYYTLEEVQGVQIVSKYEYQSELNASQMIKYILIITLIYLVLIMISVVIGLIVNKDIIVPIDYIIRGVLTEGIIVFLGYALYNIICKNVFTYGTVDNIILALATVIPILFLVYLIWTIKIDLIKPTSKNLIKCFVSLIEAVCFANAILACIDFVNAGSNYAQGLALREMCSWFGLAILVMAFSVIAQSRLRMVITLIYSIITSIVGYHYVKPFIGTGEPYQTAYRSAIMFGIWGILILLTIIDTVQFRPKLSLRNSMLVGIFFFCLLIFRRSNIWELAVVVPFTTFILRAGLYKRKENILDYIGNGVLLSFIYVTCQSLIHRPFHYYIYIRYAGVFTTVTVTSVYLALVFAVVVVKLFGKLQKSDRFKDLWIELSMLGIVSGYQFLTLSRTGIMTCIGIFMVAIFFFFYVNRKNNIRKIFKISIFSLIAVFLGFICVFGLTRMIPAIINKPTIYAIEEFQDSIHAGEPINSARYITLDRFLGLSTERILGIASDEGIPEVSVSDPNLLKESYNDENEQNFIKNTDSQPTDTVSQNDVLQEEANTNSSALSTVSAEYSNGRFDIFKNYINNLNLEGHDAVGLTLEDGSTIIHAHNSFIQMAYDCGILTGFIFIVLYIMLGFRSIRYYFCRYKSDLSAMMPMLIFAAFGIASMVEYVFRPTIPLGFVFLAMFAPLLTQFEHQDKQKKRKSLE